MTKHNALTRRRRPDPAAIIAADLARDRRRLQAMPNPDMTQLSAINAVLDELF